MTAIPYSMSSVKMPRKKNQIAEKLLQSYSQILIQIDNRLNIHLKGSIEEKINEYHVQETLDYWLRKFEAQGGIKFNINDFLFIKLIEIGAFNLGNKEGIKIIKMNPKRPDAISNQSKQKITTKSQKKQTEIRMCFVIPIRIYNTLGLNMVKRMLNSLMNQKILPESKNPPCPSRIS